MGDNSNQFGEETRVSIKTISMGEEFINYAAETNAVVVIGYQLTSKYIGTWKVTVVSEYVDPRGRFHMFENDFSIEVYGDRVTWTPEEKKIETKEEQAFIEISNFEGIVIREP